jgi:hypothetical protein
VVAVPAPVAPELIFKRLLLLGAALYGAAWACRIYARKYYVWLPDYLRWSVTRPEAANGPVHIFFCYADQFEPGRFVYRTERWAREYPLLAQRHKDSAGRPLQHTWFYPGDDIVDENFRLLQKLAAAGYGEVELHFHHRYDDYESARRKYAAAIEQFQKFGFLQTTDGKTRFAFCHGNNSLDNSIGPWFCGVNSELKLLRSLGCFADFTFPSIWNHAQPSMVNAIYEAADSDRAKSYDRGERLRAGRPAAGDLLIFTGPLVFSPAMNPRWLFLFLENGDIHSTIPLTRRRVDDWIRANVHVEGRPDWVFVKVTSHGAGSDAEAEETLGRDFDGAISYLEARYNDGSRYVLHYVTAREAYNLARAAAANQRGDPSHYLNWQIAPYLAGAGGR